MISCNNSCYRPQTKLREGNVFTGVCDSVHGGVPGPGGCLFTGGCLVLGGACSGGGLLLAPGEGGVPGGDPPNGYCCGQYASYWNAFLYFKVSFTLYDITV